jgi:hypothetical protein
MLLGALGGWIAVSVKRVAAPASERQLVDQFREDVAYYERRLAAGSPLVGFFFDPELLVTDPRRLETVCVGLSHRLTIRCVVSG